MNKLPSSSVGDWFARNIDLLVAVDSASAARDHLIVAAREAGFDSLACGEIDLDRSQRSAFQINTWPAAWFDYYRRERLHESDPIVRYLREGHVAFAWSDIEPHDARERRILAAVRAFGWKDGLVIGLPRLGCLTGLISLTAREHIPAGAGRDYIIGLFTLAYERLRGMNVGRADAGPSAMTPRELDCLALVGRGKHDPAIAEQLDLSVATVREYVERAKKRLDCHTRAEAVAVAIALGLIAP